MADGTEFDIKDIIYIITLTQTGGNFVDWSVNYLLGETNVSVNYLLGETNVCSFSADSLPITHEPLTHINAHNNKCRLCIDQEAIDHARAMKSRTIYYHPSGMFNEISEVIDSMHNMILLSNRYNRKYSNKLTRHLHNADDSTILQYEIDWHLVYNSETIDKFNKLGLYLNELPVLREFLALVVQDNDSRDAEAHVDVNKYNTFVLDTRELYTTFDIIIFEIFSFFNLTIDESRVKNFRIQYNKWKNMQYAQNKFSINFDRIVDYILNGINYDLACFKLDVKQEACILQALLKKGYYLPRDCKYTNTKHMFVHLEDINNREFPMLT